MKSSSRFLCRFSRRYLQSRSFLLVDRPRVEVPASFCRRGALFFSSTTTTPASSSVEQEHHIQTTATTSLHLRGLNHKELRRYLSIPRTKDEIQELVKELESSPTLTEADMMRVVLPLSRAAGKVRDLLHAALLTERILFACLSKLDPDPQKRGSNTPYPLNAVYNQAIIGWGNRRSLEGAQRAQRLFDLMVSEHAIDPNAPKPCRRVYKSLLRAWAVSNSPHAAFKAWDILQEMEAKSGIQEILNGNENVEPSSLSSFELEMPDRSVYNMVLSAYAREPVLKHPHALKRIHKLITHMNELYERTDNVEFALDQHSYNAILRAYSRYVSAQNASVALLDPIILEQVQEVLDRVLDLDEDIDPAILSLPLVVGVVVQVLVKTWPLETNVQKAHDYILGLAGRNNGPTPSHPSRWRLHTGSTESYPRQESIRNVMQAWEMLAPTLGEAVVRDKIEELVAVVVDAPYERVYFLDQAVEEWAKSGWEYAPDLIEKMIEVKWEQRHWIEQRCTPTGRTFLIAIKAWLRCRRDEAPYRAELLFKNMLQMYEETRSSYYRPREMHIRYVMTCWIQRCKTGKRYKGLAGTMYPAEHNEELLRWIAGSDWISNEVGHLSMAIRSWASQVVGNGDDEPNPIVRASKLLDWLEQVTEQAVLPAYPCNWVLEACCRRQSTIEGRHQAYEIAIETFRRSQRNARSFVLLVQVFKIQVEALDEKHLRMIEDLFQECCAHGQLTQEMCWEVVEVASAEALQKLFGVSYQYASFIVQVRDQQLQQGGVLTWGGNPPNALLVRNLPSEWSCNNKAGT